MTTSRHIPKLARGMTLAFKPEASAELADIPACVVDIWPRFRSGEYLVTLEYAEPVNVGHTLTRQIEAFASELYQPNAVAHAHAANGLPRMQHRLRLAWA